MEPMGKPYIRSIPRPEQSDDEALNPKPYTLNRSTALEVAVRQAHAKLDRRHGDEQGVLKLHVGFRVKGLRFRV